MKSAPWDPGPPISTHEVAAEVLRRTATLGAYFSLAEPTGEQWRNWEEFLSRDTLREFTERTRSALAASSGCAIGSIPPRMAASSFHLAVSARLLSPVIGAATCESKVPMLTHESTLWAPTAGHCPDFGARSVACIATTTPQGAATAIAESVIEELLAPLGSALKAATGLSEKIIEGNVISSANGAVTVLAMRRPDREQRGRTLIEALLNTRYLSGTGHFANKKFTRHSCCLFYTGPHGGLCGDCILATP